MLSSARILRAGKILIGLELAEYLDDLCPQQRYILGRGGPDNVLTHAEVFVDGEVAQAYGFAPLHLGVPGLKLSG